jgi:hypothetical protein
MFSVMGQKTPSVRPTGLLKDQAHTARTSSAFVERLAARLGALCAETGLSVETATMADGVLRNLVVPWSRVEAFARNPNIGWVSEISDDNTPIEFSVTISPAGSEVRVLFEPQGEDQTLAGHREAALRFHEHLAQEHGADLSRFRMVSDLFTPPDMRGPFALWSRATRLARTGTILTVTMFVAIWIRQLVVTDYDRLRALLGWH